MLTHLHICRIPHYRHVNVVLNRHHMTWNTNCNHSMQSTQLNDTTLVQATDITTLQYLRHSLDPQNWTSLLSPEHMEASPLHSRDRLRTPLPHVTEHELHCDQAIHFGHCSSLHIWIFSWVPLHSTPISPPMHSRDCAIIPPPQVAVHPLNWLHSDQAAHGAKLQFWVKSSEPKQPRCP